MEKTYKILAFVSKDELILGTIKSMLGEDNA